MARRPNEPCQRRRSYESREGSWDRWSWSWYDDAGGDGSWWSSASDSAGYRRGNHGSSSGGKGQQGQQKGTWVWVPQAPAEPELPPRKWPKEGRYDRRSAKAKAIREMKGVLRRRQASEAQPDASAASGAQAGEVQAVSAAQAEQPAAPCCKSSSSCSESGTSEPDCEPPSVASSSAMEDIAGRSVCQQKAGSSAASAADSSAAAGSSAAAASSAAAGSQICPSRKAKQGLKGSQKFQWKKWPGNCVGLPDPCPSWAIFFGEWPKTDISVPRSHLFGHALVTSSDVPSCNFIVVTGHTVVPA